SVFTVYGQQELAGLAFSNVVSSRTQKCNNPSALHIRSPEIFHADYWAFPSCSVTTRATVMLMLPDGVTYEEEGRFDVGCGRLRGSGGCIHRADYRPVRRI